MMCLSKSIKNSPHGPSPAIGFEVRLSGGIVGWTSRGSRLGKSAQKLAWKCWKRGKIGGHVAPKNCVSWRWKGWYAAPRNLAKHPLSPPVATDGLETSPCYNRFDRDLPWFTMQIAIKWGLMFDDFQEYQHPLVGLLAGGSSNLVTGKCSLSVV